ncbi:MAG: hypothetical protein JSU73_02810 [candidate division WOR-3 bacterium]|nr:MAG: hypothetical protein JSU73_02810 [candidate division WOR-3 bacterium]
MKYATYLLTVVLSLVLFTGCPGPREETPQTPPPAGRQDFTTQAVNSLTRTLGELEARLNAFKAEAGADHPEVLRGEDFVRQARAQIEVVKGISDPEELMPEAHKVNTFLYEIDKIVSAAGK